MRRVMICMLVVILCSGFRSPELNEEVTIIVEIEESVDDFVNHIQSRIPRLEVVAQYNTIFNGAAIKGTVGELEKLARLDTVVQQYPVKTYRTMINDAPSFSTDMLRQRYDLPFTGKGVKVGVIDTGIDYTHPDLAGAYRGGFDMVDFDEDPMETQGEGETMHGTHVAGVIAANGKMKGIAPEAELYAYRALGPGGVGSSVQVIAAIEEAVEDGVDVINLSLGNDVNGPDWPTSHAVNKAIELGTTVVVAAGNSGPQPWTVGSPATSTNAITVGASSMEGEVPLLTIPGERKQVPVTVLLGSLPWELNKKYPIMMAGKGLDELDHARGKIALFERGEISFTEKAIKAYQAGAAAVIIYNNEEGIFQGALEEKLPIPVASVSKEDGEWLKSEAVEAQQWVNTIHQSTDEGIALFSSRGPVTTSWEVKPDLVAPGVNIFSTVPGGYQPLQGTSMAAPHVAGVVALMLEAHPDWTPEEVKASLLSSADVMPVQKHMYDPTEQGSGLVDISESIHPELVIESGALEFGRVKDEFFRKQLPIKVKNTTNEQMEIHFERPATESGVSWRLPSTISLAPGESKEERVELQLSKAFIKDGVHQGYVKLESGGETYHLPYLYLKEDASYEKITGFELNQNPDREKSISYRFHLTEKVEKVTVDLYRAGTMLFQGQLVEIDQPEPGLVEGKITKPSFDMDGPYIAVVNVTISNEKESYTFPVHFSE
ncbi:S8 family serine peptidase [Halobacillus mangrovi]|uniref:Peptidase n=1 Tax=Halobacillus mangrovi TaxID=402384 RepID=A0A1W5ZS17_9BACI|nr:S8 family serine peptidase [Halobacillus mangrovi]ARI76073.1 peptidase [Halobacillus mangrovi]